MKMKFSHRSIWLQATVVLMLLTVSGSLAQAPQDHRKLVRDQPQSSSPDLRGIALVIGNGAYTNAPSLKNPANDATLVASTLKKLGFDVAVATNKSQREMKQLIREFGQRLRQGGVGLFYFAGHGVQSNGHNYLIPIDADIESEAELIDQSVDVNYVLSVVEESHNSLNIVILDACRTNPFAGKFRSAQGGLAEVSAPSGTLIAYATSPDKTAADGDTANSPYTEELAKQMEVDDVLLETTFRHVAERVSARTRGRQEPWISSNVKGAFYFKGGSESNADHTGIFLTRMVNPPDPPGEEFQLRNTAVWLSATGAVPYVIDSITITHHSGTGEPIKSAADRTVVSYAFKFSADSTKTHVLEPALEVNPKEGREVPLTFVLVPEGFFPTTSDHVEVSIHYHAVNGDNGSFDLTEPSEEGQLLARLLGTNVETYDLVVTPNGAHRGNGPYQSKQPKLVYQPMERFPPAYLVITSSTNDYEPPPSVSLTPERLALNLAIEKKGGINKVFGVDPTAGWVPAITRLITEDKVSPYAVGNLIMNICSALSNRDCDEAFAAMRIFRDEEDGDSDRGYDRVEDYLAVKHVLNPSAKLADFILGFKSLDVRFTDLTPDPVSGALTLLPSGRWAEALIKLASAKRSPALLGLYLRRAALTPVQQRAVEDLAWKNLEEFAPQEEAVRYLVWRGKPVEDIRRKLTDPTKGNHVYRLELSKEILDSQRPKNSNSKRKGS